MDTTNYTGHYVQVSASAEGEIESRVEFLPLGKFQTAHPKPITAEIVNAEALIKASLAVAPANELPIDFDHGIEGLGQKNGQAAGWIKGFDIEGDRIFASVEWTPAGKEALEGKLYRFLSPVWNMTKSGRVTRLLRAGLTNNPALPQLTAVASASSQQKETEGMDPLLQQLVAALGLPTDATEETAMASVTAMVAASASAGKIIEAAGLEGDLDDTKADAIVTALASKSAGSEDVDPTKFVPMAVFEEQQIALASLQSEVRGDKVAAAISAVKAEGKLSPSAEKWATDLATKDMDSFKAWASTAPVIMPKGELIPSLKPTQEGELTADEKKICAAAGVSEEAFLATKTGKQPEKQEA